MIADGLMSFRFFLYTFHSAFVVKGFSSHESE
jgi:hypothetical protein